MSQEIWAKVKSVFVSNHGRLSKVVDGIRVIIEPRMSKDGRLFFYTADEENVFKRHLLHREVALNFVHNEFPKKQRKVFPIDGNYKICHHENLTWEPSSLKSRSVKLNKTKAKQLREDSKTMSNGELAKKYNISCGHVSKICKNGSWFR